MNDGQKRKDHLLLTLAGRKYPYAEIAFKTGLTVNDVSVRLCQLRKLKEHRHYKTFAELWFDRAKAMGLPTTGIL